jgi:hypothetical protein
VKWSGAAIASAVAAPDALRSSPAVRNMPLRESAYGLIFLDSASGMPFVARS